MSEVDREAFREGYLAEVEEHLGAVARSLGSIGDQEVPHPRAIRDVFRSLHTIKGLSAMVGIDPIVELAHEMEAIVRTAEKRGGRLPSQGLDLLAEGVRAIEQRLRQFAARQAVSPAPPSLLEALGAAPAAPAPAPALDDAALTAAEREQIAEGLAAGRVCTRVDVISTPGRAAAGLTITAVRERVAARGELIRVVPRAVPKSDAAPSGLAFSLYVLHDGDDAALAAAAGVDAASLTRIASPAGPPVLAGAGPLDTAPPDDAPIAAFDGDALDERGEGRGGRVVRVEVGRLDDALERLSTLLVTRFRMSRAVGELRAKGVDTRRLEDIMGENARQLRDLRGAIMRVRMVSVAALLERVPLMLRGLTRASDKSISLTIDAGSAELDKAVGEQLFPAIVHVIRNAVDHGIEPTAARRASGKAPEGRITITCHERGSNQLELTIADDGRGVDAAEVARRANRPVPRTDDELLQLLVTPGLSTRTRVTTTSGRGLGLDIVHRIVRDLGGALHLSTRPGQGTEFKMRVPLSITIVDAFSFESAGHVFVAPVASVDEIVEVDPARTTRTPRRRDAGAEIALLERRGAAVPLIRLDEIFGIGGERLRTPMQGGIHDKAIIVRRGNAPYGFQVDRMLGQQEVVVRPVVDELVRIPGVTGSTDLGDGRPVLVLDLIALVERLGGARLDAGALP